MLLDLLSRSARPRGVDCGDDSRPKILGGLPAEQLGVLALVEHAEKDDGHAVGEARLRQLTGEHGILHLLHHFRANDHGTRRDGRRVRFGHLVGQDDFP